MEKQIRALNLLRNFIDKKKATVRQIQSLAGLNFLNRAIFPGKAFTHRMYAKYKSLGQNQNGSGAGSTGIHETKLKSHHHLNLDSEFRNDCWVWERFLSTHDKSICRPFIDLRPIQEETVLDFYTDAAKKGTLGFGGIYNSHWLLGSWGNDFIEKCDPSIEYLELFGLVIAVFAWSHHLQDQRSVIHCDNQSVVTMVNDTTSSCKNCMVLIRLLMLRCLEFNMRIFAKWVRGSQNSLSDALSRMKLKSFWRLVKQEGRVMDRKSTLLPVDIWPPQKLWLVE